MFFLYLLSKEKDREVYKIENKCKEAKRPNNLENRKEKRKSDNDWKHNPEVEYIGERKDRQSKNPRNASHHEDQL